MRGDAFFRDSVHFLGANLNFKGLPPVDDRGVQRLIEIGARHRDVVFETAGHGTPDVMDDAECGIAVALRIRDDAYGEEIVNLVEAAALADDFSVQREEAFEARFEFGGNSVFDELCADGGLNSFKEALVDFRLVRNFFLQSDERFRFQTAEA